MLDAKPPAGASTNSSSEMFVSNNSEPAQPDGVSSSTEAEAESGYRHTRALVSVLVYFLVFAAFAGGLLGVLNLSGVIGFGVVDEYTARAVTPSPYAGLGTLNATGFCEPGSYPTSEEACKEASSASRLYYAGVVEQGSASAPAGCTSHTAGVGFVVVQWQPPQPVYINQTQASMFGGDKFVNVCTENRVDDVTNDALVARMLVLVAAAPAVHYLAKLVGSIGYLLVDVMGWRTGDDAGTEATSLPALPAAHFALVILMSIRKQLHRFLVLALFILAFSLLFKGVGGAQAEGTFVTVLRFLCSALVHLFFDVVAESVRIYLIAHFHKETYWEPMYQVIQKEFVFKILCNHVRNLKRASSRAAGDKSGDKSAWRKLIGYSLASNSAPSQEELCTEESKQSLVDNAAASLPLEASQVNVALHGATPPSISLPTIMSTASFLRHNTYASYSLSPSFSTRTTYLISSKLEASAVASRLFQQISGSKRWMTKEDLGAVLPAEVVEMLFAMLDTKGIGQIVEKDMVAFILTLYKERKALVQTMNSTRSVFTTVSYFMRMALLFVSFFLWMYIFGYNTTSVWVTYSSVQIVLAFLLADSIRSTLSACLLFCVVNPFDIGDLVQINGEMLRVAELGLHYITYIALDNTTVIMPTQSLSTITIKNITRSKPLWMSFSLRVDMGLSTAQLNTLEEKLQVLLASDPGTYRSETLAVYLVDFEPPLKVDISIWYQLGFNCTDNKRRYTAHTRVLNYAQTVLMEDLRCMRYTGVEGSVGAFGEEDSSEAKQSKLVQHTEVCDRFHAATANEIDRRDSEGLAMRSGAPSVSQPGLRMRTSQQSSSSVSVTPSKLTPAEGTLQPAQLLECPPASHLLE